MSIALTYERVLTETDEIQGIIKGCMQQERAAQAKLYHHFYPKMMAMVRRYFPQPEHAEEILNNGFLKAFQKMNTFQFKGSFEGWLRKIVFHSVSDYVKANIKYTNHVTSMEDKEYFIHTEDADNITYQELLKLIHQLPGTSRVVFNMYVLEGLPHKQIGEMLDISEGTSKWHLSEARKILKNKIKDLKLI